jgi:hypothetical protein
MLGYLLVFLLGFFVAAEIYNTKFRESTKIFLKNTYAAIQEASRKRKEAKQQRNNEKHIDAVK